MEKTKFSNKHLFAIYEKNISQQIADLKKEQIFCLQDKALHKRVTTVLRLKENEQFIIFDQNYNATVAIEKETFRSKNKLTLKILSLNENKQIKPDITLCPALLKKNTFEEVVYYAAQMGGNIVQPIISEKVHKNWWSTSQAERLEKIMISACEQSKNFILPELKTPIKLQDLLQNVNEIKEDTKKVVFEAGEKSFLDLLNKLSKNKFEKVFLFFGPESGFSQKELEILKENKFEFYALTPTILRAREAIAVGLGGVRSVW